MNKLTTEEQNRLDLIQKELFYSEIVKFDYHEGYKYNENIASFGIRVGPKYSISDGLLHEMAHVSEVQNLDRLKQNNFGLCIKKFVEVFGKFYPEPTTWNSTKLELRTILWQEVLAEKFDIKFNRNEFCKACNTCLIFLTYQCVDINGLRMVIMMNLELSTMAISKKRMN